ncbi:methylamine utilization protein MauE, partial [Streptomyces sp. NRRL F-6602]
MNTPLGLLGSAATAVVLLVLLAGCAAHLTRPAALPGALRAHAVLPGRVVGPA